MASNKFTDEQLSRIFSAHANGELRRLGWDDTMQQAKCCINQAAMGVEEFEEMSWKMNKIGLWNGSFLDRAMTFFDAEYNPGWPLGRFLRELEARGLA